MPRLENKLLFWMEHNLITLNRSYRYCIQNNTTSLYQYVFIEVLNPYTMTVEEDNTFPDVPAGSRKCFNLTFTIPRGVKVVRARGQLGAETDVITNHVIAMYDTEVSLANPKFLDKIKIYRMYGLYKGVWYGGVYYLGFIPRPSNAELLFVETIDGEVGLWTKSEIASGNMNFGGRAWKAEVSYQFPSLEAISAFLEQYGGGIASEIVRLEQLTPSQRIDILLPIVNFRLKAEQFTPLIEVDKTNRIVKYTYQITAGLPLLQIAVVAGLVLLGIAQVAGTFYLANKIQQTTALEIETMAKIAKVITDNQVAIAEDLIDILDPSLLVVPKEQAKAILRKQGEIAKKEIDKIKDASITNAFGAGAEIPLTEKLKYAGIGALAGGVVGLLLGRR